MEYIEFHARSAFSFLEGASLPETLIETCSKYQMPAMALVDRHGIYGSPRFHMAAKRNGIKAHVGAEVSVVNSGNYPLLVKSRTGYQNLCRLITSTKLRTPKKEIAYTNFDELRSHAEGLICLTGDENGPLGNALNKTGLDGGRQILQQLAEIYCSSDFFPKNAANGRT